MPACPWATGRLALPSSHVIPLGRRTLVMGIVNVTPDSFSDGGSYATVDDALKHAIQMVADGAELLDVGGESTRPGSDVVASDEEIRRVVPVIRRIVDEPPDIPVSVDTRKAAVARAAAEGGAAIVNDVSGERTRPCSVWSRAPAPA